jgi:hypothetical protein
MTVIQGWGGRRIAFHPGDFIVIVAHLGFDLCLVFMVIGKSTMDLGRGQVGKMLQDFFHGQTPLIMPHDITDQKTSAADNRPRPTDGGFALHISEVRNRGRNICVRSAGIICRP